MFTIDYLINSTVKTRPVPVFCSMMVKEEAEACLCYSFPSQLRIYSISNQQTTSHCSTGDLGLLPHVVNVILG